MDLFRKLHSQRVAESSGAGHGFAIVDIETTGLSSKSDRIVDIAIVHADPRGRPETEWHSFVNPERPMGAAHIHGLTDAHVASAPRFAELVPTLIQLLRGRAIVAHNASFDVGFLRQEFGRVRWAWPEVPCLCTQHASNYYLPDLPRRTLATCCAASGIQLPDAHTALGDARATAILLQSYLDPAFGHPPRPEHFDLPHHATSIQWPEAPGQETAHARIVVAMPSRVVRRMAQKQSFEAAAPMLGQITLRMLSEHGAPPRAMGYVETLLDALEDGQITDDELAALTDVAEDNDLTDEDVAAVNHALAQSLAQVAATDGVISAHERTELKQVLVLLGIPEKESAKLLNEAKNNRLRELSQNLPPLPHGWAHGEPLRVGDSIAFTGGDDTVRERQEKLAQEAGVYVGGVTKKTAMLVTDGSFSGGKRAKADEFGTRLVDPQEFDVLLRWIQPFGG